MSIEIVLAFFFLSWEAQTIGVSQEMSRADVTEGETPGMVSVREQVQGSFA